MSIFVEYMYGCQSLNMSVRLFASGVVPSRHSFIEQVLWRIPMLDLEWEQDQSTSTTWPVMETR